jgi:hypothetical protein
MAGRAPLAIRGHDHNTIELAKTLGEHLDTGGVNPIVIGYEYHTE